MGLDSPIQIPWKKNSINLLFDVNHNHNSIWKYNFILAVVFFMPVGD